MDIIFNELSIGRKETQNAAQNMMEHFVIAFASATAQTSCSLRIHESLQNLYAQEVSEGYLISQWANDPEVDRNIRSRFKSIVQKSPLIDATELEAVELWERSEYKFGNAAAIGAGAAHLLSTLCLSLKSNSIWDSCELTLQHSYLDEELNEHKEDVIVKHFSDKACFLKHLSWLQKLEEESVRKGNDLWENRETLFPHLFFCAETEKQLIKGQAQKYIHQVYKKLKILNEIAEAWNSGQTFDYNHANSNYAIVCSPETDLTLENYSSERTFKLPSGEQAVFSLHIKMGDIRLHFYPDPHSGKICVGYIGAHLKTWLH
jgi:hypothetical protein